MIKFNTLVAMAITISINFSLLNAQQPNPVFTTFKGVVYKIPARRVSKGYTNEVRDYQQIAEIELTELNIPERPDSIRIPGIAITNAFGILFASTMTIAKNGHYLFSLSSDDGSRLYIDNKSIIDNDKLHRMREIRDTTYFAKGSYPVKIWYFQGIPDRYGLIFKATFLNDDSSSFEKTQNPLLDQVIVFTEKQLQFDDNSFKIAEAGIALLDSLAKQFNQFEVAKIILRGHTDSRGSSAYNLNLSIRRAEALKSVLRKKLKREGIEYVVEGVGEKEPVANNNTAEGRALNRRVEIKVEREDENG